MSLWLMHGIYDLRLYSDCAMVVRWRVLTLPWSSRSSHSLAAVPAAAADQMCRWSSVASDKVSDAVGSDRIVVH